MNGKKTKTATDKPKNPPKITAKKTKKATKSRGSVWHACPFCKSACKARKENQDRHMKSRCLNYPAIERLFQGHGYHELKRNNYEIEIVPKDTVTGEPIHSKRPFKFLKEIQKISQELKIENDPEFQKLVKAFEWTG